MMSRFFIAPPLVGILHSFYFHNRARLGINDLYKINKNKE
ncbi:hypothetical protein BD65_1575 [Yersinia ruckeri]|nr:hypothetical protein BD65_1575 [Yersinia ruckeri]